MPPTPLPLALEALVARVEAGDPLPESDLRELERTAAARPDSVDWQLCLAHALLNSDRPEAALRVLEGAAHRAPDEPLVRLARARGLGALDRHEEAAAELRAILARQPGHADARRALALMRLRAGAPADAAELVRAVLETDPTDDLARQILGEAEAALAQPQPPSLDAFARDLQRSLLERGLRSRRADDRPELLVELQPGRVGRLSLPSLHEAACADPRGPAGFAEALVGDLSRLQAPKALPALDEVRARLLPALRPASFPARAGPVLCWPGPGGLLWSLALDHGDFVTFVPAAAAEGWGLANEALLQLGLKNLDRAPVAPTRFRVAEGQLVQSRDSLWDVLAFDAGDGFDAARLLAPAHRALLDALHPGPWVVALPTTGYALLAREADAPALALLQSAASSEASRPDALCAALFTLSLDLTAR